MGAAQGFVRPHLSTTLLLLDWRFRLRDDVNEKSPYGQPIRGLRPYGYGKGVSFKNAVRKHARNSLVPLATSVGHQVTLFVTGSFLIETIFGVDGFGLLGFNSVIDRDYPVVMGVLTLSASLMLLGNILSDALVALLTRGFDSNEKMIRLNPLTLRKIRRFRSIRRLLVLCCINRSIPG